MASLSLQSEQQTAQTTLQHQKAKQGSRETVLLLTFISFPFYKMFDLFAQLCLFLPRMAWQGQGGSVTVTGAFSLSCWEVAPASCDLSQPTVENGGVPTWPTWC